MSNAIQTELGAAEVLQNQIPREWMALGQFKNRTEEMGGPNLRLRPYIGAFEVYHKDVLLYSKLACRMWPNCMAVAKTIKAYFQDQKGKSPNPSKYSIKYEHPSSKSPCKLALVYRCRG